MCELKMAWSAGNPRVQFCEISSGGVQKRAVPDLGGSDWLDDAAVDQRAHTRRRGPCCLQLAGQHDSRGYCLVARSSQRAQTPPSQAIHCVFKFNSRPT